MWVRKSEEEIQLVLQARDERRKILWPPLAAAAALTATVLLLYSIGFRYWSQGVIVVSSAPTHFGIGNVALGVVLFLIFSVFLVRHQRRHGAVFADRNAILCRDCKQPCHPNEDLQCECGGRLEDLEYFDWVSESETAGAAGAERAGAESPD